MDKKQILVADYAKMKTAIDNYHKMLRKENHSSADVFNTFGDLFDSFEEQANESDESIVNRVLDSLKDSKLTDELVRKAIDDEFAKRDYAKVLVDRKDNPECVAKFCNEFISNIEKNQRFDLVEVVKHAYGNDISGLMFPTPVETAIRRAWERSEYIFRVIFNHSRRSYIPYTTQDWRDNNVMAHIHESPDVEKVEQNLELQYLSFSHEFFYKLQYLKRKEIELARQAGTLVDIVAEIMEEATQQLINAIVYASLVTGASASGNEFITPIARRTSDAFVNVATMAGANATIPDVRAVADKVIGYKHIICTSATKTNLSKLAPGNTSGMFYMREEDLLAQTGCQEIHTFEGLGNMVIVLADQAFTIGGANIESFRFDKYEYNKEGYLVEMLCAGGMRSMNGAGVILPQDILVTISSSSLSVTDGTIADGSYTFITGGASEVVAIASGVGTTTLPDGDYQVISDGADLTLMPA